MQLTAGSIAFVFLAVVWVSASVASPFDVVGSGINSASRDLSFSETTTPCSDACDASGSLACARGPSSCSSFSWCSLSSSWDRATDFAPVSEVRELYVGRVLGAVEAVLVFDVLSPRYLSSGRGRESVPNFLACGTRFGRS